MATSDMVAIVNQSFDFVNYCCGFPQHPRRLDRSAGGAQRRDLLSTKSRQFVERRSLRYASLREASVETTGIGNKK
jgi:hypothetical protein